MSMDGEKTVMLADPMSVAPMEPAGEVEIAKGPKELKEADLQEYAQRTGVAVVKLKGLQNRAIMGELIQRLGAARVGSSMLVDSEQMILEGIKLCDQMLGDYAHEPNVIASIIKVRLGLVQEWVKAAQAHIKSKKDAGPEESESKPQQRPPPPLIPVQINISGNKVSEGVQG